MGRAKVFDETKALDRAMHLFWQQGYSNTSLKQLLHEMDMLNGSFYHCFKDKKTVFLRSLDYYNQEFTYKRQEALISHDDFSLGIRALFVEIFKTLESKDKPYGCLIVNSMTAEVLCDEQIKTFLYKDLESFVQFMTERIQRSIDLNFTSISFPAKQLSFILVTYIQGLFRLSNANVDIKQLKTQTECFLQSVGL